MSDKFQEQVLSMLQQLQVDVKQLQTGQQQLQGDVKQLQGDVKQLQGDVKQLQGDVKQLQGDVKQLQGDVKQLQEGQQFLISAMRELRDETSRTFMHQSLKNAQFETDLSMLSFRLAHHKHDM